jgi:hypothetical protein
MASRLRSHPPAIHLLHRDDQAIEIRADDGADRTAGQRQHRAVLVGEHNGLRAPAQRRADVSSGIDAGDIPRAADVAHRAAKVRLGSAEGEAVAQPADPERVLSALEGEGAGAGRAADDKARFDDAETDAAAVGIGGGPEEGAGQGRQGDQACPKGG